MNPRVAQPSDPAWLKRAFADLGLKEIVGPRHSARVLEMFRKAGHPEVKDDETAWCAAAVGCWLNEAGLPNSGSLMARSYVRFGRRLPLTRPIPRGAIGVIPRGKPPSGHVFLVLHDDSDTLITLGGNQRDSVSLGRVDKAALISAVWPDNSLPKPKSAPAPKPAQKPAYLADPPPPDIEPSEPSEPSDVSVVRLPWWKKIWFKVTGGAGAVGILGYLTDPWVVVAITGSLVLSVALFVWFMGPDRVRVWVRKKVD